MSEPIAMVTGNLLYVSSPGAVNEGVLTAFEQALPLPYMEHTSPFKFIYPLVAAHIIYITPIRNSA